MLQAIIETVVDNVLQVVGWSVLKVISFGRYRGFRAEDVLVEGTLGFVILAGAVYCAYRWWPL